MARKKINDGELWTVLAETSGEGVGLPRGTRILIRQTGKRLELTALGGDWDEDEPAVLEPLASSQKGGAGPCDPEWCWEGKVKRPDGTHTVKVGLVENDPGICTLFVNPDGTATIRR